MTVRFFALAIANLALAACITDAPSAPFEAPITTSSSPTLDLRVSSGNDCEHCAFGPAVFESVGDTTERYRASFSADPVADYVIDLAMTADADSRVRVAVNGVTVIPLSDDSPVEAQIVTNSLGRVVGVRKSIALAETNEIDVTLTGAGSRLAVRLLGGARRIGTSGGSLTSPGGLVRLVVPAGALPATVELSAQPTRFYPGATAIVPGTVFDMAPSGTQFSTPAQLSIKYDPSILPSGVSTAALSMLHAVNGAWLQVPGAIVDETHHMISASVSGFSSYAIGYSTSPPTGATIQLPIPSASLANARFTQGYAAYGDAVSSKYHTGMDVAAVSGSLDATAAADAWIVLVQENDSPGRFSGVCRDPAQGISSGCADHGFGNTVILQHGPTFTQYSHLASID